MRSCTFLIIAFLIFFHSSLGFAEVYTRESFDAMMANTKAISEQPTCKQIASGCSAQANEYRKYYAPAAISCQAQQQALGCDKLVAAHPELKSQMASCDIADLCESNIITDQLQSLKGCFWNAPGEISKDTWNDIKHLVLAVPGAAKKGWAEYKVCMADADCRKFTLIQAMVMSNPITASTVVAAELGPDGGKKLALGMYNAGKKWLTEQNIKYQCFNPQAQSEMVCYAAYWAVINVVAPEKLGALALTKVPLAIKALKGAALARKGEIIAVDTVKGAKIAEIELDGLLGGTAEAQTIFIGENTNRIFTSVRENEKWIEVASQSQIDRPTKFYDIENSAMKRLNDTTDNKNLVTALTNKQKEIFFNDLHDIAKKYPDMEFISYSDFKSVRVAVRPKSLNGKIPAKVNSAMQDLFTNTNKKFSQYLMENKVVDASAKSQEWFRAGSGTTADKASLGARYSRSLPGENLMVGFGREDLQTAVQANLNKTEAVRSDLQKSLSATTIMETVPGTERMTLSKDTFEIARKAGSANDLKSALALRTGTEVTDAQAKQILQYSKLVDDFSPSIRVAERQVTSLEDAVNGGMTIDFVGLGAQNSQATANALARTSRIKEALIESRQHESVVTKLLDDKKKSVTETIQKILKEQDVDAVIKVSGDDMVIKPSKPLDTVTKEKITEALAQVENPSSLRLSSVSQNVTDGAARSVLAAQGETVEKVMRKFLAGKIPNAKLQQTMFMVDVDKAANGSHQAKLIMSNRYSDLTKTEKLQIQKSFHDAIQQVSKGATKVDTHYALEPNE